MTINKIKLILFLIAMAVFQSLAAQKVTEGEETFDLGEQGFVVDKKRTAREHVFALKKDTLLVRLNTDEERIAFCIEKGAHKKAKYYQDKVDKVNDEMVSSFQNSFDFCQFYFFYSKDSDAVLKEKDYSKLFDKELKPYKGEAFSTPPYLLFYTSVPHLRWNNEYHYVLYNWDFKKVERIENLHFRHKGTRLFSKTTISDITNYTNNSLNKIYNKQKGRR